MHPILEKLSDFIKQQKGNSPMPNVQAKIEEGTRRVLSANQEWSDEALTVIADYVQDHDTFTSEQLRGEITEVVGPPPGHPSAWGALILRAARKGLIVSTGQRPLMQGEQPNGHGRVTTLYTSATC